MAGPSQGPIRIKPSGQHKGRVTTPVMIDSCYEFGRKSTDKFYVPFEELPSKTSLRAYMRKEGLMIRMAPRGCQLV